MAGAPRHARPRQNRILPETKRPRNSVRPASSRFTVTYTGTDSAGVENYTFTASNNGPGMQQLRVVRPMSPRPRLGHNFLYALPVQAGLQDDYGDGLRELASLDVHNQYNVTIVSPTFSHDPWYADNPKNPELSDETFMTRSLVPWVRRHLSDGSAEQNWLIGFSKSGVGAQTLLLRNPDLFAVAASWDFPANMSSYRQYKGNTRTCYGTNASFKAHYELTDGFISTRRTPFMAQNRIWIGGYEAFGQDVFDYSERLASVGIKHTSDMREFTTHRWDSGWVPAALAAMCEASRELQVPAVPAASSHRWLAQDSA